MSKAFVNRLMLVLCAFVLVGTLGCGSRGSESGQGSSEEGTIQLVYMAPGFPKYDKIRVEQGKKFEAAHPHVKTKFQSVAGQGYREKLLTQIAGGSAPDVFFIRDFNIPQFARKQALLPLAPLMEQDANFDRDDVFPQLVEAYSFDGEIYALPGSSTTRVLYFNPTLFDEQDVAYPNAKWTWSDFLNAAQQLTKRDERGMVTHYGASFYLDSADGWLLWILQNGGQLFNEEKTQCVINSPESREALEFVKALAYDHKVTPTTMDQMNQDSYQLFLSGRAAMFIGGRWYTVNFREARNLTWDIASLPKQRRRATMLDSHGWAISSQTQHPKEAWELLKQLAGPEGVQFVIEVGDSMPTLRSLAKTSYFPLDERYPNEKHHQVFLDSLEYAYSAKELMHPNIAWFKMSSVMNTEIDRFLLGESTAEQALQAIEQTLNKLIEEDEET